MYGIYGDIITAAERALESFEETEELLEYPEVQADKAYYLSVLSKYNSLKSLKDGLHSLKNAIDEEKGYTELLSDAADEKMRADIYREISYLQRTQSKLATLLSDALGCKRAVESAYCRFKFKEASVKFGLALCELIKSNLLTRGAKISQENVALDKSGKAQEVSFVAVGEDVITRLTPLTGAHKVYCAKSKSQELCFAVTSTARVEEIDEKDLKIDVFHSHGAGGQNINKVETAVRVTHLPTGMVVVCQDERSQLKNKRRALENIARRLQERTEQCEKNRIEADIFGQYSNKSTHISFDAASDTMTDARLKAFVKIPFPLTDEQFELYINGLTAL